MKLKTLRNSIFFIALLFFVGGVGYRLGEKNFFSPAVEPSIIGAARTIVGQDSPPDLRSVDFSEFWQVWQSLQDKYYDKSKLDPQKMVYGAIFGMVASLKDPWTQFLPPQDNQRAKEDLNGQFEGIGIQLGYKNDRLAVVAPLKGLPAEKQGVKSGDLILHLKDEARGLDTDTNEMTIYEAVDNIRGEKGTAIELTLQHEGADESYKVSIKRDTISVPSVELSYGAVKDAKWIEEKDTVQGTKLTAVLKLNRFGDNTLSEWVTAVDALAERNKNDELTGMVLDLRNNPGGYLSGAVSLASEFIGKGVVVKQQNGDGTVEEYNVNRRGQLYDIPLTVLVNKGSASASEILAGALRAHKRAKIAGEKSFGKGTIQEALEFDNNTGLHVTTAKWLFPDGKWVNDTEGIEPDIVVENQAEDDTIDLQLLKAAEELVK